MFKFKYNVLCHAKTHDKDEEYLCHEEGCEYTTSSYKLFMDHAKMCGGMCNMHALTAGRNSSSGPREAAMRPSIVRSELFMFCLCDALYQEFLYVPA